MQETLQKTAGDYLDEHFFALASGSEGDPSFTEILDAVRFDQMPEVQRAKAVAGLMERARERHSLAEKLEELQSSKALKHAKAAIQAARNEGEAIQAELDSAFDKLSEAEASDSDDAVLDSLRELANGLKESFPERLKEIRAREFAAHQTRVEIEQQIDETTRLLQRANDAFERLSEPTLLPLHIRRRFGHSPKLEKLNRRRVELSQLITQAEVVLSNCDPTKLYTTNNEPPSFTIDQFNLSTGCKIFSDDLWKRPQQYAELDYQVIGTAEQFAAIRDNATAELAKLRAELRSVKRKIDAGDSDWATERAYYQERL